MDADLNSEADDFLNVAIGHKLISFEQVESILQHASENGIESSDSVLSMSILEPHEVDAVKLLASPSSLYPGYELVDLLGCGTGGLVFLAHQKALERNVALKTINVHGRNTANTGESRIQREAQAIAKLQHPNIVSAYDSGFSKGRFCIAMEFVPGDSLSKYIENNGPLNEYDAWEIIRQAASALAHAADHRIIHRDIKPSNLLLCEPPAGFVLPRGVPFVKVADFGLALEFNEGNTTQLTATGTALGTPAYVAPEQLQDSRVDLRADIYSLGATFYHMLAGKAPFSDFSPIKAIMLKTLGEEGWRDEIKETVTAESYQLFLSMTEIELDERISSYTQIVSIIEEILAGVKQPKNALATESYGSSRAKTSESSGDVSTLIGSSPTATKLLWAMGAVISIALAVAAAFLMPNVFKSNGEANSPQNERLGKWVVDDVPISLFNGKGIPAQAYKPGTWTVVKAADSSRVLKGVSPSKIRFPLSEENLSRSHVRLRLRTSLSPNSVVEFDIEEGGSKTKLATVRFSRPESKAIFLPQTAAVKPIPSNGVELKPEKADSDEYVLWQNISITKHDTEISVVVNGQDLGSVQCEHGADTFLLIRCEKADSIFADIDIVGLKFEEEAIENLNSDN